MNRRVHTLAALVAFAGAAIALAAPTLNVGSKRFTESYILGEILKQTAQSAGETNATHSQGLGNTAIVLNALTTGSIDVYPEYTGTIAKEILKLDSVPPLRRAQRQARADGAGGRRSSGLQQHLRAGDARRRRAFAQHRAVVRPQSASRRAARTVAGIHRTRRRLAGIEAHVRAALRDAARPRSRARVRSHRAAPGRCDRHLLDRCQARQVRLDGARRRPHVLPALRRGAAVPRGSPAAPARDVGGAREAARARSTTLRCAG